MSITRALHVNLYIFTDNGQTMTTANDRPDLSSEGAPDIDKTVNGGSTPRRADRLNVGRNVTE
jgi:hypothetical protein